MFVMFRIRLLISFSVLLAVATTAVGGQTTRPSPAGPLLAKVTAKGPLLLHLPGVGGYLGIDRRMLSGLRDAGVDANIVVYDWTERDPGIHALQAYDRNRHEAEKIAGLIAAHAVADPRSPIYITAHSGGCGLAAWALADLPEDVKVQTVMFIAPALSPRFDLSAALRHVDGRLYVFSSRFDTLVLFTGTRIFGTIDGVQTEAAGFSGFIQPKNADPLLYQKVVPCAYQTDWAKYGDSGDHIGGMSRAFATAILAPLISAAPTTQADAKADSPPAAAEAVKGLGGQNVQ
jgi:pimeloyl-ACP methyl ester carboxylesterase